MKKRLVLLLVLLGVCSLRVHAQSQADVERMMQQVKAMQNDPQKLMKFRDSIMHTVTKQQSRQIPNGEQLVQKHHYDTGYVKVKFNYSYSSTETNGPGTSKKSISFSGQSVKAPKLYEANGHIIVRAFLGLPTSADEDAALQSMDNTAKGLKKNVGYPDPGKAQHRRDIAAQMSFSSMAIANKKLTAVGSYSDVGAGPDGTVVTSGSILQDAGFGFEFDPVQNYSTITASGNIHTTTHTLDDRTLETDEGIGMSGTTDRAYMKMAGVAHMDSDPDAKTVVVVKTPKGFLITYTKNISGDHDGLTFNSTEVLNVTIGEDEDHYEAVIMPYKTPNYEHWQPCGPKPDHSNDNKGDDSLRFNIVVRLASNPAKIYPGTYSVKWKLSGITHYPGICSNYPEFDEHPDTKPDIIFSDSLKADKSFIAGEAKDTFANSQPGKGNKAIARINCMDYGGSARLSATVTLDDGDELLAVPYYQADINYLTIPYDRDDNKLADVWEKKVNILGRNFALNYDKDFEMPANGRDGDGIYLIDEYRGFVVDTDGKAGVKRFDPRNKELLVVSTEVIDKYMGLITKGSKLYTKASGVITNTIGCTSKTFDFKAQRTDRRIRHNTWVNYNSPIDHNTYGVAIYFSEDPPSHPSEANTKCLTGIPVGNGAYPPKYIDRCNIFYPRISLVVSDFQNGFLPKCDTCTGNAKHLQHARDKFHLDIPVNDLSTIISREVKELADRYATLCIAHELGHATNVHHHHIPKDNDAYLGVQTCVMRYWVDPLLNENTPDVCTGYLDRLIAFLSLKWDPNTGKWPDGQLIKMCTSDDDCMHQLNLTDMREEE